MASVGGVDARGAGAGVRGRGVARGVRVVRGGIDDERGVRGGIEGERGAALGAGVSVVCAATERGTLSRAAQQSAPPAALKNRFGIVTE